MSKHKLPINWKDKSITVWWWTTNEDDKIVGGPSGPYGGQRDEGVQIGPFGGAGDAIEETPTDLHQDQWTLRVGMTFVADMVDTLADLNRGNDDTYGLPTNPTVTVMSWWPGGAMEWPDEGRGLLDSWEEERLRTMVAERIAEKDAEYSI